MTQGLTLLCPDLQWTTRDEGTPEVQWGLSATALTHTAAGSGFTYNRSSLCGAPANTDGWVDPGYLHRAVMTGLKDSTRYYYKYGQVSRSCRASLLNLQAADSLWLLKALLQVFRLLSNHVIRADAALPPP